MVFVRFVSNLLFWLGFGSLVVAIVLFEAGTRYMRQGKKVQRKKVDKVAWKFLASAGILFGLSLLIGLL